MGELEHLFGEPDRLDEVLAELRKYPHWPVNDATDRPYLQDLSRKYRGIDLLDEAFRWRMWMLDHQNGKEVKPRARFANWIRGAGGSPRLGSAPAGTGQNRTNPRRKARIAPGRREEFGSQSSENLSRW